MIIGGNNMGSKKIYYYTDFNTFKLILQNGTLRFKESTSSNDNFDTVQLYENLFEMAIKRLDEGDLKAEQQFFFDMQKHNGSKSTRISLVSCFTSKADSRMLWDAYTMHRKDRSAERYNGLCIEFDKNELLNVMLTNAQQFDVKRCQEIVYGFESINDVLEKYMDTYSYEVREISQEEDQTQNLIPPIPIPLTNKVMDLKKCIVVPTLRLVDRIDAAAPFFKHSFWREEYETRALLSIKKGTSFAKSLDRYSDGSAYFDLQITKNCINKVILGPEFSKEDAEILNSLDAKITFNDLMIVPSEGTGVITNR